MTAGLRSGQLGPLIHLIFFFFFLFFFHFPFGVWRVFGMEEPKAFVGTYIGYERSRILF